LALLLVECTLKGLLDQHGAALQVLDNILYLEEEAQEEMSQNWGDETKCTYAKGYIDQPVYSCRECSERTGKQVRERSYHCRICLALRTAPVHQWLIPCMSVVVQFGFCYGCSMKCHVDHTVFELFEKRHFRCDCGVPRSGCACTLDPSSPATGRKLTDNDENNYNHNFDGLYCWCNQPYDHSSDVTMYMCVVCQDWFHEQCLKDMEGVIPAEEDFDDFFCKDCTAKHPFLLRYHPKFNAFPQQSNPPAPLAGPSSSSTTTVSTDLSTPVGEKRKRGETVDSGRETKDEDEDEEEEEEDAGCKLTCTANRLWRACARHC
jgi:E3 ubiquitin-protein ligase UBR7